MPTLYILCGMPASGKTTWANEFSAESGARHISRDQIRFSLVQENELYFSREDIVFAMFVREIAASLREGKDVIADATHLNKKSRRKLIYGIDRQGIEEYQIIFVWFNTSILECVNRNNQREGRARVPMESMYAMWHRYSVPQENEDKRCIDVWEIHNG